MKCNARFCEKRWVVLDAVMFCAPVKAIFSVNDASGREKIAAELSRDDDASFTPSFHSNCSTRISYTDRIRRPSARPSAYAPTDRVVYLLRSFRRPRARASEFTTLSNDSFDSFAFEDRVRRWYIAQHHR